MTFHWLHFAHEWEYGRRRETENGIAKRSEFVNQQNAPIAKGLNSGGAISLQFFFSCQTTCHVCLLNSLRQPVRVTQSLSIRTRVQDWQSNELRGPMRNAETFSNDSTDCSVHRSNHISKTFFFSFCNSWTIVITRKKVFALKKN